MAAAAPLSDVARAALVDAAGPGGASDDAELIAPRLSDWRGRTIGGAALLLRPAHVKQVAAIVRAAGAHGVAIVPQGGRTGLVGGALPNADARPCVLVGMDRMARIRDVDAAGMTLVAEAGAILSDVHDAARAAGRRFPLSLGAKGSATIGGLIATNAGGTQVLRHGTMRARVIGLEAVLPDGSILRALGPLAKDNTGADVKQLLIGSEGTLGIVTAAALALAAEPPERLVAWAGVRSPGAALALLAALRTGVGDAVESFEILSGEAAPLVAEQVGGHRDPLPGHAWVVLVEVAGAGVRDGVEAALIAHADDAVIAESGAQADALWAIRETVPEAERREGPAVKLDIALPVARLPAFVDAMERELAAEWPGARVFAFGHLGDGNLHYNVRAPVGPSGPWLAAHGGPVMRRVHDRVMEHGGSISAEHGIGAFKADEWARVGDPAKRAAQAAIKRALDPMGLMNPGKLAL